jgi:5-methylcytosine-specific restriction protein A
MHKHATCAGCTGSYLRSQMFDYRRKKWCGDSSCKDEIDRKVKHKNYKIRMKRIANGTFRNGVDPELRKTVLKAFSNTCTLCGYRDVIVEHSGMEVHHIVPVSEGGSDDIGNLTVLCHDCHTTVHQIGWESYAGLF